MYNRDIVHSDMRDLKHILIGENGYLLERLIAKLKKSFLVNLLIGEVKNEYNCKNIFGHFRYKWPLL